MFTVYYLFAKYRKEEFRDRLAQRAETTVRILLEVKEVDEQLLKIIDRNSINRLYNEKTLIFNDSLKLIYSSLDDATIKWTLDDLKEIKRRKQVFKRNSEYDFLGIYYPFNHRDYYALISAEDRYGIRKLNYLKFLLLGAFITGTLLVWMLSFYASRKTLQPLDKVRSQMQEISTRNLNMKMEPCPIPGSSAYPANQMNSHQSITFQVRDYN